MSTLGRYYTVMCIAIFICGIVISISPEVAGNLTDAYEPTRAEPRVHIPVVYPHGGGMTSEIRSVEVPSKWDNPDDRGKYRLSGIFCTIAGLGMIAFGITRLRKQKDKSDAVSTESSYEFWGNMLNQLVRFKEANGHCDVPERWSENRRLGLWVYMQRQAAKQGKLDPEHAKRLNEIGFKW